MLTALSASHATAAPRISVREKSLFESAPGRNVAAASNLIMNSVFDEPAYTVPAGPLSTQEDSARRFFARGKGALYSYQIAFDSPEGFFFEVAQDPPGPTVYEQPPFTTIYMRRARLADDIREITIRNSGTGTLNLQFPSLTGPHADDYFIEQPPQFILTAGATTTIRLGFISTGEGERQAILHLPNDSADLSGFFVYLSGDGDKDGDGLPNTWETAGKGIDFNHDGTVDLDLNARGARPDKPDLFVEMDTDVAGDNLAKMVTGIAMVKEAFEDAKFFAVDGTSVGITLHVDLDETALVRPGDETNRAGDNFPRGFETTKARRFGTALERANGSNTIKAKEKAYRYCYVYDEVVFDPGVPKAGGRGELGGNDMTIDARAKPVVLLGDLIETPIDPETFATVFMHELGHNLNLGHGGSDDINFKPNYPSIMNYALGYRSSWNRDFWRLDYSRNFVEDMNETSLDETRGLNAPAFYRSWKMPVSIGGSNPIIRLLPYNGTPFDFNGDGRSVGTNVSADINSFPNLNYFTNGTAQPSPGQILRSFPDWGQIVMKIRTDGEQLGAPVIIPDGCGNLDIHKYLEEHVPVTAPTFDEWAGKFINIGDKTGFADDPDGDGVANAVERFLGTHPAFASKGLEVTDGGGIQHTRSLDPGTDTTASYEWSTDLVNWHAEADEVNGVSVTFTTAKVGEGISNEIIHVTPTIDGEAPKMFFRMRVQVTEEP